VKPLQDEASSLLKSGEKQLRISLKRESITEPNSGVQTIQSPLHFYDEVSDEKKVVIFEEEDKALEGDPTSLQKKMSPS